MAKRKTKNDRWARGWATRRAKVQKLITGYNTPLPKDMKANQTYDVVATKRDGAIEVAIQQPNVTDLIMAAARKRNGRAAVDELISGHVTTRSIEYQRQNAMAADLFQRATLEHHRDEVICSLIAEFEAARGLGSANVWKISHRFWAHVVHALKAAGYSAHGRANGAGCAVNQEPRG